MNRFLSFSQDNPLLTLGLHTANENTSRCTSSQIIGTTKFVYLSMRFIQTELQLKDIPAIT